VTHFVALVAPIQDKRVQSVKEKAPIFHKVYESDFKIETAIRQAITAMFAVS
jgi:hypothetical protein